MFSCRPIGLLYKEIPCSVSRRVSHNQSTYERVSSLYVNFGATRDWWQNMYDFEIIEKFQDAFSKISVLLPCIYPHLRKMIEIRICLLDEIFKSQGRANGILKLSSDTWSLDLITFAYWSSCCVCK